MTTTATTAHVPTVADFGAVDPDLGRTLRELPAESWAPVLDVAAANNPAVARLLAQSGDLRARLLEIAVERGLSATERYERMARAAVEHLRAAGQFYFHRDRRDFATAMYFDRRRKLLLRVQSDQFAAWLSGDVLGFNREAPAFRFVLSACATAALDPKLSRGIVPELYWAARPDALYLSCGDGAAVRMTADGPEAVDNGTDDVLFAAGGALPAWRLTDPADPFAACALFNGASYLQAHGLDLVRLWGTLLPTNARCKPPLVLAGAVGSGKTRLAAGVAELYGLPLRVSAVTKDGEGDFWTALDAGGLSILDNADTSVPWLADALAAAATGGTRDKRRLYTDAEVVQLSARAWAAVTSCNPSFAADAGLADRLLVVRMGRREGGTAESALSDELAAHRDAGLSWVAHALSGAMADARPVPPGLNKRHPDFAAWAVRVGRAIGREAEAVAAIAAAEADKSRFNLENDTVGAALLALMQERDAWTGTAAELLASLTGYDEGIAPPHWTARRVGKRLSKVWPHVKDALRATQETGHGGAVRYSFRRAVGDYGEFPGLFSQKSP